VPSADELRTDLKTLARRNALKLSDENFQQDADDLIQAVEKDSGVRNRVALSAVDSRTELRQKLLRRLIWKVPIIILLIAFAVWWELHKEGGEETKIEAAADFFTGAWSGEVTYGWDAKYIEPFFFQPEGNKLFGTASFLGVKRGIEEGKVEGETISFFVRYEEVSGGESRERKNYYWGKLNGKDILIRMQDDRGNPAVDWVLKKSNLPQ
jgi:hypothetical protein